MMHLGNPLVGARDVGTDAQTELEKMNRKNGG